MAKHNRENIILNVAIVKVTFMTSLLLNQITETIYQRNESSKKSVYLIFYENINIQNEINKSTN